MRFALAFLLLTAPAFAQAPQGAPGSVPQGVPQGPAPGAPPAAAEPSLPGAAQRPAPPPPPERTFEDAPLAVLQGLDKVTARTSTFEAPVGQVARFGQLEVTVRSCKKAPPIEPPESAAFLEIVELRPDVGPVPVFGGWMFASSPALSALEHPVYDVWVVDCKSPSTKASPAKAG